MSTARRADMAHIHNFTYRHLDRSKSKLVFIPCIHSLIIMSCFSPLSSQDEQSLSLDEMIGSICSDVDSIRRDAEEAQSCLVAQAPPPLAPMAMLADLQSKVTELTEQLVETQTLLSDKTSGD